MSTVNPSRPLNLDELRRLKWLLGGAVALVSLWTVFFLDIEAAGLVGVVGALIGVALIWPQLPARVPALVWKLAVPAIILTLIADIYFSPDTLPVLIRTAILLVLYRAASYRRKREDLQLIVLGLFLIVVAGVLTVSLGFAFLLLLFTACALGFLFVINLQEVAEAGMVRTAESELAWTRLGWRALFSRLRAVTDWKLLTFAAVLFCTVVVLSGLLFVLIPRFEVGSGFFLDKYITRKSRTGFSEVVKFGDVSELLQDNSVAMRVDVTQATGLAASPYWRLVVLDEYTPDGFKVSAGLKQQLAATQRTRQQVTGNESRHRETVGGTWTFYIEPGVSRYLPLPGSYGMVRLRDPLPVQVLPSHRLIALRSEPLTMTAVQVEGVVLQPTLTDATLADQLTAARAGGLRKGVYDPRILLQEPGGAANVAVLTRLLGEITGGEQLSAEAFARRATAWMQARHAYALAVTLPRGSDADAIVRWLDSNQPGFCEYFAAGLTVLARAAGHPARVVAGYRGGAKNAFENYYMVRNADAHAWVEIFDGGTTWTRVDPTPSATGATTGFDAATQVANDSSWGARTDSLRVLWYRRIVNFDSRNQVQMIDSVKNFTSDSGQKLRAKLDEFNKRVKAWLTRPWDFGRVGRLAALVAALAAACVVGWRLGRWTIRRWSAWRRSEEYDPVRREAGRWLAKLRERCEAASAADRSDTELVVTDELQRLRFGRRETWPEPRGVFKRARTLCKNNRR